MSDVDERTKSLLAEVLENANAAVDDANAYYVSLTDNNAPMDDVLIAYAAAAVMYVHQSMPHALQKFGRQRRFITAKGFSKLQSAMKLGWVPPGYEQLAEIAYSEVYENPPAITEQEHDARMKLEHELAVAFENIQLNCGLFESI
jgi:hypothetical protein